MSRTDTHRPSVIVPEDYYFVAIVSMRPSADIFDCMSMQFERERLKEHMESTGAAFSRHRHGGQCHICGNVNALELLAFHHVPSNTLIKTGCDCADKLWYGDSVSFMARVEPSDNDSKFGFFSRPTKAAIIQEAT